MTCPFILAAPVPGSRRIREDMPAREVHLADKVQGFGEFVVRFSGEAGDDVGGDRHVRDRLARGMDQPAERLRRGLAEHPPQRGSAPGLQRQVQVRHEAGRGPEREEVGRQVPGFERGKPQARRVRLMQNGFDEVGQVRAEVIAPRTEVDAGQDDLVCAAVQGGLDVEQHIGDPAAAPFAACDSGDAKRAGVVAPVLHFDEGARAAVQTGQGNAGQRFKVKGRKVEEHLQQDGLFGHWRQRG
ncbi:MAG: hypothetical protein MZV64_59325 [Ignavibacteriales bacterium]|nr:hypothetical protein [Ignavibacteriales bacterium]